MPLRRSSSPRKTPKKSWRSRISSREKTLGFRRAADADSEATADAQPFDDVEYVPARDVVEAFGTEEWDDVPSQPRFVVHNGPNASNRRSAARCSKCAPARVERSSSQAKTSARLKRYSRPSRRTESPSRTTSWATVCTCTSSTSRPRILVIRELLTHDGPDELANVTLKPGHRALRRTESVPAALPGARTVDAALRTWRGV